MGTDRRTLNFYQADVFTDVPFGGNPVAIVPEASGLTNHELQQIAREMNLSETVFIFPAQELAAVAKIRIFTPSQEIPFAGHPVLGAFFVLGKLGRLPLQGPVTRVFHECNIGVFPVDVHCHRGEILRVVMTQPKPEFLSVIESTEEVYELAKALGMDKSALKGARTPVQVVSTGLPVVLVPVRSLTAVRSIVPDPVAITDLCARFGASGIMVFTQVTVEPFSTVHTRMFASPIGVLEDPATGSASGALGAYLVHHGIVDVGPTTEIIAEQGYELDRPARIVIQVESDDDAIQEVKVGGQVVLVLQGEITF